MGCGASLMLCVVCQVILPGITGQWTWICTEYSQTMWRVKKEKNPALKSSVLKPTTASSLITTSIATKSRLDRPRPDKKNPVFKLGWASFYLHGLGIFSFASHLWSFNAFLLWKLNCPKYTAKQASERNVATILTRTKKSLLVSAPGREGGVKPSRKWQWAALVGWKDEKIFSNIQRGRGF